MPGGLHPPPEVIASWPVPNHTHPERQGKELTVLTVIMSTLGIITIAARLYSRLYITRALGWDDAMAVLSLMFAIALSVLLIYVYQVWGTGMRIWDLPIAWAAPNRLVTWISEWLYILASSCIKISILLFYKRLSAPFPRSFLIATWVGIVYNVFYLLSFLIAIALLCNPTKAYWKQFDVKWMSEKHEYHCDKESISLPMSGALSVVGDLYSTMLPLLLVYHLHLPGRQKKALYALFFLGFIAVGAGIGRTYYLNFLINETYDVLWYLYIMWIWTVFELYFAIIAASAPALKPFIRQYLVEPVQVYYGSADNSQVRSPKQGFQSIKGRDIGLPFNFRKNLAFSGSTISATTPPFSHTSDVEGEHKDDSIGYEMKSRISPTTIPEVTSPPESIEKPISRTSESYGGSKRLAQTYTPILPATHQSPFTRHPYFSKHENEDSKKMPPKGHGTHLQGP